MERSRTQIGSDRLTEFAGELLDATRAGLIRWKSDDGELDSYSAVTQVGGARVCANGKTTTLDLLNPNGETIEQISTERRDSQAWKDWERVVLALHEEAASVATGSRSVIENLRREWGIAEEPGNAIRL